MKYNYNKSYIPSCCGLSKEEIKELQKLPAFDIHNNLPKSETLLRYLKAYSFPVINGYSAGYISVHGYSIYTQLYRAKKPKATILLQHGYLDHSGSLTHIVHWALEKEFNVLLVDAPGHGLSSGTAGDIDTFHSYASIHRALYEEVKDTLQTPFHILGHSNGCSGILDAIANHRVFWEGKTILISPLVRFALWPLGKVAYKLMKPFIKKTTRLFRNSSNSKEFLAFLKSDPLGVKQVPISWTTAFLEWYSEIERADFSDVNLIMIQGDKDVTVDWKFNRLFLKEKLPSLAYYELSNGRHHLPNESEEIRTQFFSILDQELA